MAAQANKEIRARPTLHHLSAIHIARHRLISPDVGQPERCALPSRCARYGPSWLRSGFEFRSALPPPVRSSSSSSCVGISLKATQLEKCVCVRVWRRRDVLISTLSSNQLKRMLFARRTVVCARNVLRDCCVVGGQHAQHMAALPATFGDTVSTTVLRSSQLFHDKSLPLLINKRHY